MKKIIPASSDTEIGSISEASGFVDNLSMVGANVALAEAHAGHVACLAGGCDSELAALASTTFSAGCHLLRGRPGATSAALERGATDAVPLALGGAGTRQGTRTGAGTRAGLGTGGSRNGGGGSRTGGYLPGNVGDG